jgi:hypothetical protein
MVGAWTAYAGASSYTYTLYSNSIYSYVGGTLVTSASPTSNTFTYASPVSGTYYYYTLNVTTAYGTSTLATSGIGQYVPAILSYTSGGATLTTLAGSGGAGSNDATGAAATFKYPCGVIQLSDGNILNCDAGNNRIRIITPAGVVTTLAGSAQGLVDGTGSGANFYFPSEAAAMLSDGKIIVSDRFNNCLRLVTYPGGVVTTFATGFNSPIGVSVLPNGNFVVADAGNNVIKYVTYPGGVVTTLATGFNAPQGVAALSNGNMVVSEYSGNVIRLVTTSTYAANSGVVTLLAGSGGAGSNDATGAAATFNNPVGLAVLPTGNIVVADIGNSRIRLVTYPGGVVTTLLTSANANDVGVLSNGNLVIGSTYNQKINILTFPAFAAPTSPTLAISAGTASMSWTAASGATAYNWILYRSSTSNYNGTSNTSGTTTTTAPTSAPTGLSTGYFWYFTVASSNTSGVSSAIVSSIVSY